MGRTAPKTSRHEPRCSSSPDTVGPTAGATEITIEMLPMTAPRLWAGTRRMMVVISSGIMMAVPQACTTRPASSTPNTGATPQINGAHAEQSERQREHLPGAEPVDEPPRHGNHHGHGEHERGRQPLHGAFVDPDINHDPGERNVHSGLVEDHHEGRYQQDGDDRRMLSG